MVYTVRYVVGRIARYILVLFLAVTINFAIPRMIPGNPIQAMLQRLEMSGINAGGEAVVAEYTKLFGLEGNIFTQYVSYIKQLLRGNLGPSISYFPASVSGLISTRLPWTIGLLMVATIISFVAGNILGAALGWRKSKTAKFFFPLFVFLNQIPYYILALVLVFLFAYIIPLFPPSGGVGFGIQGIAIIPSIIYHATLPALSIILSSIGVWAIGMRALMLNVKGEDFIQLAEAKGLKENNIFMRYAMRNAILPQVTSLALSIGFIVSGAILTEVIFAYPGLGQLLLQAIGGLDYNVIQGITLLLVFAVSTATLIMDLIYPLIDSRISYAGE